MLTRNPLGSFFMFLTALALIGLAGVNGACANPKEEQVRYCYDRSSFPTKVVIVCKTCQCPAGYY